MIEQSKPSERIFEANGQWFYRIRGEQNSGPYPSRSDAEKALSKFVRKCRGRMQFRLRLPTAKITGLFTKDHAAA